MINGSFLRDFYIDVWRRTPALVAAMNGDEGLIRANNAVARLSTSLARTVQTMGAPMIYVAYQGFGRGNYRHGEVTKHAIVAYIRAATVNDDDHINYGAWMVDGVATGESLKTRYLVPHIDADPMDMPQFTRAGASTIDFDIWELSFTVAENVSGDSEGEDAVTPADE